VLLDLAVGSLFHEVMKFRESFYQREVYGPQVRALRGQTEDEAEALFGEFERILATVSVRLGEGLQEVEALLEQTRSQLARLLAEHADDGLVMRCLIEHRELVEEVFGEGLDALLGRLQCGRADRAFALAGGSYLESGHYEEAERAFAEAEARGGDAAELRRGAAYARGMRAYLAGSYAESVAQLAVWAREATPAESFLAGLAQAALSKLDRLVPGSDRAAVLRPAGALVERLSGLRAAAAAPAR
jgi:hypothetical protein